MIGRTFSHYKILEKLGGGGMGVVYRAEDTRLKRDVALKFLPPDLTRDSEAKKRFMQEAQAASALEHPNICNIHEIEETQDGQLFIVMSCYQGETLNKKIKHRPLSITEAIDISTQILLGLSRAHEVGIIHRDIKPANIMLTERGEIKILDFGVAKLSGQTRSSGTDRYLGTVAYMSPEQTRGENVDYRTDIWSVGVVFYEMITGRLPFTGEYDQAIIYSILNEEPPPVTNQPTKIMADLNMVLKRAMAKNVGKRYNYVEEFMVDLVSLQKKFEKGVLDNNLARIISPFKNRLAVLPFANFSPDPDDEYFADGMTEELIATLSKVKEFKVIARTSVMQYKKTTKSVSEIGRELSVGNILESSVRKAGNRLRISVQLINSQSEENLWSQVYDREFKDIFTIQSDIAKSVAKALQIEIISREKHQIEKKSTDNLEAYSLYLKGRYWWNKRNEEGLKKSIEFFEKAIELDPFYALSHSGIADAYIILGNYGFLPPDVAYPKAKLAAEQALKIDNSLAQAYTSLGCINSIYFWNWSKAEHQFEHAIELNPKYATAYHWHAINYLIPNGKFEEAIAEINRAKELDPLSLIINTTVGLVYYFARDYDRALEAYQKTLELDPEFEKAHFFMGWALEQQKSTDKSIDALKKTVNLSGNSTAMLSELASTYATLGEEKSARKILNEIGSEFNNKDLPPYSMYSIAACYAAFGNQQEAIDWLNKAFENRLYRLIYLKVDPKFDSLRSNSEFKALLVKVGLGE